MLRLIALLALLPATAQAQWSPTPRAFSYDAAFAQCTLDPERVDAAQCGRTLRAAFRLNHAAALAVKACDADSLRDCPLSFEDRGLTAIAARIAVDSGCDNTDAATFPASRPLPTTHCITTISDILRDEGVVPFNDPLACTGSTSICHELDRIHAVLWSDAVRAASDSDLTRLRLEGALDACEGPESGRMLCQARAAALIWADLAQNEQDY